MSIRDARRPSRALVFATVFALAAFPALAMPMNSASRLGERGAFTAIFETFRSVWLSIAPDGRPGSEMINVHENEGMSIDPSGRPTGGGNANPGEGTDEGMSIDPNG